MGLIIKQNKLKWRKGRVPFTIDFSVAKRGNAKAMAQQDGVMAAIDEWNSDAHNLGVTIVRHQREPDFIVFKNNPVTGSGGSNIGNHHGPQVIWVSVPKGATNAQIAPSVMATMLHEIGHALGLYHEQNRRDRDDHVEIHWDNVQPIYLLQFNKESPRKSEDFGDYDFDSIMHYGPKEYAIDNKKPVITSKDPGHSVRINSTLSDGDLSAVRDLYGGQPSAANLIHSFVDSLAGLVATGSGSSAELAKARGAVDAVVKEAKDAAGRAKRTALEATAAANDAGKQAAEAAKKLIAAAKDAAKAAADKVKADTDKAKAEAEALEKAAEAKAKATQKALDDAKAKAEAEAANTLQAAAEAWKKRHF